MPDLKFAGCKRRVENRRCRRTISLPRGLAGGEVGMTEEKALNVEGRIPAVEVGFREEVERVAGSFCGEVPDSLPGEKFAFGGEVPGEEAECGPERGEAVSG